MQSGCKSIETQRPFEGYVHSPNPDIPNPNQDIPNPNPDIPNPNPDISKPNPKEYTCKVHGIL